MQRVAEHFGAVHEAAQSPPGLAEPVVQRADSLLDGLGEPVEPRLFADDAVEPALARVVVADQPADTSTVDFHAWSRGVRPHSVNAIRPGLTCGCHRAAAQLPQISKVAACPQTRWARSAWAQSGEGWRDTSRGTVSTAP